ncbi:DNA (cytosine-5-)-methyltransferase, partial [Paenibacillus larvae]|nr:DNA (cytosine-5-)-methyltransferase [Paenibacillus larvae]
EGTTKSRVGGVLDGLSDWLDRYKWPAGLGQEQYDWEPARIETSVQNRVGRIKALGNAVNPVQVYPILAAIKAINDQI